MRDGQEFKRFIQEYLDANIVTNQSNNEENVAEAKRLLSVMSEDNDALEQLINIVPLSPPSKDGMAGPKTTLEDSTDSQKLSRRSSENPQWGARISDTEIDRKTSGTSVKQFQRPTGSINQSNTIPINGSEGGSDPDHRGLSHKLIKPLGQLTDDEDAMSGRVKWSTYLGYFNSWRPWVFCISVFSYLTFSGFQVAANIWLERFTSDPLITNATGQIPKHNANKNEEMIERVDYYMIYYGTFGVCQVFSISLFWLFFMFGIIRASRLLHIRLLDGILRVPMSFFDTTPSGRILNRFSKDIDQIDHVIPFNLSDAITCFIQAVTSVIVIIIVTPWFMLLVLPLAIIYYLIQLFYLPTCRQSRRLGSIASSPIFSHFTETLTGCSVVRAFRTQVNFQQINHSLVNRSNTFLFLQYASTRWLSVRLDALGNLMVFGSVLFALIDRDNLTPSLVGLSVSYALQMTDLLNWLVRQYSELETNSVALERVHEYSMVPSEAAWDNPDTEPGASWPTCGAVKLSDLSVRYRDGLPLVLTGVSADLCSGERVGVVGRTGAGKSSLAQALFRLVEPAGGSIFIDQVDISCLGLHRLRAGITILPQDPIVFSGSLRTNLDPLHRYKDKQLWDALRHSHLYEWASTLQQPPAATVGISDPLLYECGESGANLSTGQKQLLCLARALLRKSRVLILDEATASVDVETDRLVMQTVRKQFQESTVIIIAHRVNTILDCDRVLVLDQGRIAELDTPQNLLSRPGGSLFKSLADQSNRPSDL